MLGDIFLWLVANVNLGKQACGSDKRALVYHMNKIRLKIPNTCSFLNSPQGKSPHIVLLVKYSTTWSFYVGGSDQSAFHVSLFYFLFVYL